MTTIGVYDERRTNGRFAIRVTAYRPRVDRHGVVWASADNAVLFKDLALRPGHRGSGLRMGRKRPQELAAAQRLDRMLDRANRRSACRKLPREPQLPRLWAAFPAATALTASGPEFERLVARFGLSPQAMQAKFTRREGSLTLLPLDWVSDRLGESVEVYADLEEVPLFQVFSCRSRNDLAGYRGASSYDFFANRFRARYEQQPNNVAVA